MTEVVPIIQADRLAAYELMASIGRVSPRHRDAIMRGDWDEASKEIQAFARHRIAGQAELVECRRIIEGLATLDQTLNKKPGTHRVLWKDEWHEGPMADAFVELVETIAAASRAALAPLSQSKGEG